MIPDFLKNLPLSIANKLSPLLGTRVIEYDSVPSHPRSPTMSESTSVQAPSPVKTPLPSTLVQKTSNPGALEFAGQPGAVLHKPSGRFADFQGNLSQGWRALHADLGAKINRDPDMTLKGLISIYAPPNENDTKRYYGQLANMLGVSPSIKIGQLKEKIEPLAKFIAQLEGFYR